MQENEDETDLSKMKLWAVPVEKWLHIQSLDRPKRNGIHPDVFKDKIQGLHQSNTSYLF